MKWFRSRRLADALPLRGELLSLESLEDRAKTLAALFNEHQPLLIADVWSDDPQAQFLRAFLDDGAAALLKGMRSWMWVPLAVKGRVIGGVGVAHQKQDYFTPHHADLALSVANQAAITMINSELRLCRFDCAIQPLTNACIRPIRLPPWSSFRAVTTIEK